MIPWCRFPQVLTQSGRESRNLCQTGQSQFAFEIVSYSLPSRSGDGSASASATTGKRAVYYKWRNGGRPTGLGPTKHRPCLRAKPLRPRSATRGVEQPLVCSCVQTLEKHPKMRHFVPLSGASGPTLGPPNSWARPSPFDPTKPTFTPPWQRRSGRWGRSIALSEVAGQPSRIEVGLAPEEFRRACDALPDRQKVGRHWNRSPRGQGSRIRVVRGS